VSAVDTGRRDRVVGVARPRIDAAAKVTGAASYTGDRSYRGLLHGRPVLGPYAHARILSVDTSEALAVPGVHDVLLHGDLPLVSGSGRGAEPLAADEVVFAGQPVALVLAETEAAAEDGAALVFVDYDLLPAVVDLEAALDPMSPPARLASASEEADVAMHGDAGTGVSESERPRSPNVVDAILSAHGDLESALAGCVAVASGRFHTSWVHQVPLEPQVAVAWPEGAGGLGVWTSTQSTFYVRQELAQIYGIPLASVRVEASGMP
jgi:CO/xanthine dehydrogenase Mo-binding subunit